MEHYSDDFTTLHMTLLRWVTFLHGSLTVIFSLAYLDLLISSDASICYTMAFLPLGNSDHVVALVSIEFLRNSKQDVPFHRIAYEYSRADWNSVGGFKLKLMHIFLVVSIWSNLTHLHGLKRLALLP